MRGWIGGIVITHWPFVTFVALASVAVLALLVAGVHAARRLPRRTVRVAARGGACVVVLLVLLTNAAVGTNAGLDYLRTPGDLLGTGPGEQFDVAQLLLRRSVPRRGVVAELPIPGSLSGFDGRPAQVWLPPAWFARPRPALPVIVLLHGTPGRPQDWVDSGGAADTADAWAAAHDEVAPILVMPDVNGTYTGDTECVDAGGVNAETYLARDVPRVVRQLLGTRPPGRDWAVAGLSEGGSCAVTLALRHPETFGTFGDFAGLLGPRTGDSNDGVAETTDALFDDSAAEFDGHEPAWLLTAGRYPRTGGWFEAGDADADPAAAARQLAGLAPTAGIETHLVVVPGAGHDFDLFSRALSDSFAWLADRVSASGPAPYPPG